MEFGRKTSHFTFGKKVPLRFCGVKVIYIYSGRVLSNSFFKSVKAQQVRYKLNRDQIFQEDTKWKKEHSQYKFDCRYIWNDMCGTWYISTYKCPYKHKIIPESELTEYLNAGWEFVEDLFIHEHHKTYFIIKRRICE